MAASNYIHGSSDDREVARLEKQARFVAPLILGGFGALPGERVLDLATGVGAMAGQLAQRVPGVRLVGVDLRRSQLRHAHRNHPEATYLQADGTALPFRDGAFDRVHCSWLLEHVPRPIEVLAEVRRVLAPGGVAQFSEVDNASFRVSPELPEVMEAIATLDRAQVAAGGDPAVGQKLGRLFAEAGFSQIEVVPLGMRGDAHSPSMLQALVEEFAEIFESLDEALTPEQAARAVRAAVQLRELPNTPGATFDYQPVIARGWK